MANYHPDSFSQRVLRGDRESIHVKENLSRARGVGDLRAQFLADDLENDFGYREVINLSPLPVQTSTIRQADSILRASSQNSTQVKEVDSTIVKPQVGAIGTLAQAHRGWTIQPKVTIPSQHEDHTHTTPDDIDEVHDCDRDSCLNFSRDFGHLHHQLGSQLCRNNLLVPQVEDFERSEHSLWETVRDVDARNHWPIREAESRRRPVNVLLEFLLADVRAKIEKNLKHSEAVMGGLRWKLRSLSLVNKR